MAKTSGEDGRRRRGFERASSLLTDRIREAGESRGFAVSRLLTHWPEIVGADTAAICSPVSVKYGRGALGATLTVLTTGAHAPQLQMEEPALRKRVNACYGYAAIARIRITQTAPTGFAEGQAAFGHARKRRSREPSPEIAQRAATLAGAVGDESLRAALERLGGHVLTKSMKSRTEPIE